MTSREVSQKPRARAVFLDRDGTLNEECGYLHRPEELRFLPGVVEAVRLFNTAGFRVVVVSNQAGVARGYYAEEDVVALHRHMARKLAEREVMVDAFYFCPHHPEGIVPGYKRDCDCRKPKPGLLHRAAGELGVDLRLSFMIGDKLSDVAAGEAAGCQTFLVLTGYGAQEAPRVGGRTTVAPNLLAAAEAICAAEPVPISIWPR